MIFLTTAFLKGGPMKRHIAAVYAEDKPFQCDICDYRCPQMNRMNMHFKSVHEGKKSFTCDICEYTCSRKCDMNRHVKWTGH